MFAALATTGLIVMVAVWVIVSVVNILVVEVVVVVVEALVVMVLRNVSKVHRHCSTDAYMVGVISTTVVAGGKPNHLLQKF
jgi:hypothetical protein